MAAAPALLLGGLLFSAAGSAAGFASSLSAASQQRKAAREAQDVSRKNAAEIARRGAEETGLRRAQGRRLQARQRALVGASGLTTESFFDVLTDSAAQEEFAAQRVMQQYEFEAGDELQRGTLEAKASRRRARALVIGGATQFVGSVGSLATQAGYYKSTGAL